MYKTALLQTTPTPQEAPKEFFAWENLNASEAPQNVQVKRDFVYEAMCSGDGYLWELTRFLQERCELLQTPDMPKLLSIFSECMILEPLEEESSEEDDSLYFSDEENIF